jgi:hypothetical protein
VGEGDAEMLCVCSGEEPEMEQTLLSLNVIEPAADSLD